MRNLLLLFLSMFSIISLGQTSTKPKISYVSKNKDTLWLIDDETGRLIAESWTFEPNYTAEKRPVIIFVDRLPTPVNISTDEKKRRKRRS